MKQKLTIVKVGGAVVEDEAQLAAPDFVIAPPKNLLRRVWR